MSDGHLRQVEETAVVVRRMEALLKAARTERDEAIVQALKAKKPRSLVAQAAQLSENMVSLIQQKAGWKR